MSTADGGVADAKEKTADEQSVSLSRAEVISRSVDEAFPRLISIFVGVEDRMKMREEGNASLTNRSHLAIHNFCKGEHLDEDICGSAGTIVFFWSMHAVFVHRQNACLSITLPRSSLLVAHNGRRGGQKGQNRGSSSMDTVVIFAKMSWTLMQNCFALSFCLSNTC